jgi:hypothetical protein
VKRRVIARAYSYGYWVLRKILESLKIQVAKTHLSTKYTLGCV